MIKIFYNPETLKIMAMSDGAPVGNFPFVEFDTNGIHYHSTDNFKLVRNGDIIEVEIQEIYPEN